MPYADLQDIKDRYAGNAPFADSNILALLEDAHAIIDHRVPSLAGRVANSPELLAVAKSIVCAAIIRYMSNPDNVVQETVGPFSVSRTTNTGVYYRDNEVEMLSDSNNPADYGVGSVQLGSPFMPSRIW